MRQAQNDRQFMATLAVLNPRPAKLSFVNRRRFLQSAAGLSAAFALPAKQSLGGWRTFEVTTRVKVLKPSGVTRVWLPTALIVETPFQKTLSNRFSVENGTAKIVKSKAGGLGILTAQFPPGGATPAITLISRVATKNYSVNLSAAGKPPQVNRAELDYFRRPTKMLPTDGIVKATATQITNGCVTDLQKARAIYDWVVENTFRNPKTRGCGNGNIRFMLESHDLGGKCADLNALFVGLARASGLPARDVYGIRTAKSELGYKSLGASSENVTSAQHCRAEVYLETHGWVPVDPADVRKVVLEEPPGNLSLDDPKVRQARERLFGSWEMNWMAFNYAGDVELPASSGERLNFLLYPQAETSEGRVDSLNPDAFQYQIASKEQTAKS
jgi:transglutaminase-like putative cysteine protease